MTQPYSLPFQEDAHGTSREGAEIALPKSGTQRAVVYEAIRDHGPISDLELCEVTGYRINVICARRWALVKDGLIEDAGTKPGKFGARNITWRVV